MPGNVDFLELDSCYYCHPLVQDSVLVFLLLKTEILLFCQLGKILLHFLLIFSAKICQNYLFFNFYFQYLGVVRHTVDHHPRNNLTQRTRVTMKVRANHPYLNNSAFFIKIHWKRNKKDNLTAILFPIEMFTPLLCYVKTIAIRLYSCFT